MDTHLEVRCDSVEVFIVLRVGESQPLMAKNMVFLEIDLSEIYLKMAYGIIFEVPFVKNFYYNLGLFNIVSFL
jgi:hypothetical protein